MTKYSRSPNELREKAVLYWPSELLEKERAASILPMLLSTQDKFISTLDVADSAPDAWKLALAATKELPANLFLKHLMILSDVSGENLKRIKPQLKRIFPRGSMTYSWKGETYSYTFSAMLTRPVDNKSLSVDGEKLSIPRNLDPLLEDTIMLLLHGAAGTGGLIPEIIREKCIIGALMGEKSK